MQPFQESVSVFLEKIPIVRGYVSQCHAIFAEHAAMESRVATLSLLSISQHHQNRERVGKGLIVEVERHNTKPCSVGDIAQDGADVAGGVTLMSDEGVWIAVRIGQAESPARGGRDIVGRVDGESQLAVDVILAE